MLSRAGIALPLATWAEIEGTYVNAAGRAQRLRPAVRPPGEARPGWEIAARLGKAAGWTDDHASARAVMEEMAERDATFRGLGYGRIGLLGAALPGLDGRGHGP
jgi:predicted molibdopterin-dependent oxidoreductase YjgC